MSAFKPEDQVSIKHTMLNGVVKGAALDNTTLTITYLVQYLDNDNEMQERYFSADQIEAVI